MPLSCPVHSPSTSSRSNTPTTADSHSHLAWAARSCTCTGFLALSPAAVGLLRAVLDDLNAGRLPSPDLRDGLEIVASAITEVETATAETAAEQEPLRTAVAAAGFEGAINFPVWGPEPCATCADLMGMTESITVDNACPNCGGSPLTVDEDSWLLSCSDEGCFEIELPERAWNPIKPIAHHLETPLASLYPGMDFSSEFRTELARRAIDADLLALAGEFGWSDTGIQDWVSENVEGMLGPYRHLEPEVYGGEDEWFALALRMAHDAWVAAQ